MKEKEIEKPKTKEEKMKEEGEKEISVAEKGELPPIFMVYRDNDLFKEWVPKISETLKGLGRKVEIQSFPQGTDEKEIAEWWIKNINKIRDMDIVSDYTISNVNFNCEEGEYGEEMYNKYEDAGTLKSEEYLGHLDHLFDRAIFKIVLGKKTAESELENLLDLRKEEYNFETAKKAYVTIVKNILENKENIPRKVHILPYGMLDHSPFMPSMFKRTPENFTKAVKIVKDWLAEGGIPEEHIGYMEVKTEDDADNLGSLIKEKLNELKEEFDKQGNWIIADRHTSDIGIKRSEFSKATVLNLPVSNFFGTAKENGLIETDPEEVESEIKSMLKEDFGQKPEEK